MPRPRPTALGAKVDHADIELCSLCVSSTMLYLLLFWLLSIYTSRNKKKSTHPSSSPSPYISFPLLTLSPSLFKVALFTMSTSLWPNTHDTISMSYKKIIKQMAAQAPKVYGEIPPMAKKRSKTKKKKTKPAITMATATKTTAVTTNFPTPTSRRMSHVEDWIVVDSKESLPDEEDLVSQIENVIMKGWLIVLLAHVIEGGKKGGWC